MRENPLDDLLNWLRTVEENGHHNGHHRRQACRRFPLALDKTLRSVLSMPYEALTKTRLLAALRRLGELAQAEGLTLEVSLYGGAVFTLVYGSRDSTKDVDAIVRPSAEGKRLAAAVAQEQGLPEDWLSDDVRQFVAAKEDKRRLTGEDFGPGLKVSVPTAAYLLALKLKACRARLPGYAGDEEDITFLLRKTRPKSLAVVEDAFARFFPEDALSDRARALVQQVLKEANP